jgi:CubicO group peptidase (beta-lactamase class C family)
MALDFIVKIDRTAADFQSDFNQLRPAGYRPISLSAYQPGNPLYAAVWLRQMGPDWSAIANTDAAGYQNAFNTAVAAGYHPVILSVAGPGNAATFAGVFEQHPGPVPLTRAGLSLSGIQSINQQAQANGWIMTSGAIYGDSGNPQFAGIWPPNDSRVAWNAEGFFDDFNGYQTRFDAQVSGFARPAFVTLSDYGGYLSIFTDDVLGPFIARHGLARSDLDATLANFGSLGFMPVCLQAGGSGGDIRYAVILALQNQPLTRQFNVSAPASVPSIDAAAQGMLESSKIRGMSIAVVDGTRLVYTAGYTLAEPVYPAVLPTTMFRMASCSKVITALAIQQLIESNLLRLTETLQSDLGLTPPPGRHLDLGFAGVTLEELLEFRSGLPGGLPADTDVQAAFNASLPVSKAQVASVVCSNPLVDPTKAMAYSNLGYFLLGLVVEIRRGVPFIDAIRKTIFAPLGVDRIRLSSPLLATTYADEARYHRLALFQSPGEQRAGLWLGTSVMSNDRPMVPGMYGDRNLWNEDADGGLSTSAVDYARVIAALNVSTNNPILSRASLNSMLLLATSNYNAHATATDRRAGYGFDSMGKDKQGRFTGFKGGYLFTSQNGLYFTLDGTSLIVNLNGTNVDFSPVANAVFSLDWSKSGDLFPAFGMPSFEPQTRISVRPPVPIKVPTLPTIPKLPNHPALA